MTAILLVDDSATSRAELCAALEGAGYRVIPCGTLGEARTALRTQMIALAILDIELPDGDGLEFLGLIRRDQLLGDLPVLLLASFDHLALRTGSLGVSAADHVGMPYDTSRVLKRVDALIGPQSRATARRVLAVDDDEDYLALMAAGLRKRGYEVTTGDSGEAAIALLAQTHFDCIILDRQMPGLDGVAACKQIKATAATRDVPLMILTAAEDRDAVIEGLGAGADDFVSKKSGLDVLAARLQAQIRRTRIETEQRRVREALLRSELEAAEARAAQLVAETRAGHAEELARKNAELRQTNRELEAFSYSVSHDLRAPLRSISATTHALARMDLTDDGRAHVQRVLAASAHMADLIDALLELARISAVPVARHRVDVSALATVITDDLRKHEASRHCDVVVHPGLVASADGRLIRILLDNLIGNSWKFTGRLPRARIEIGGDGTEFYVRDNGVGFEMAQVSRLFTPFHRLHSADEFTGNGIGLATVRRIVERHGGDVRAVGAVGQGATISFTLPPER